MDRNIKKIYVTTHTKLDFKLFINFKINDTYLNDYIKWNYIQSHTKLDLKLFLELNVF